MLRVFAADLLRHQHSDLFTVGLLPQSISRRTADTKLRKALKVGTAEYLGWVVTGDELVIDPLRFSSGTDAVAKFLREYPSINRWVLDGFASESKLRIRPRYLAAEGLEESSAPSTKSTVDSPGWRVSVNSLFGKSPITIVRRDSLGRPRFNSAAHLPICWVSNPGGGNEHSMESNRL